MSDDVPAERQRLLDLIQFRAFSLCMAGPDARRLERFEDGLRPACSRYLPAWVRDMLRQRADEWAEERRAIDRSLAQFRARFEHEAQRDRR